VRILKGLLALAALYLLLLTAPYPLFAYHANYENITVYSDRPIPPTITPILEDVAERLRKSPLDDLGRQHRLFICNRAGLFAFFANYNYNAGGITYGLWNRNIFLRRSNIERNRLVGRSGNEVQGERTLTYFMTHEITHALESYYLGRVSYARLPVWKREGYADVVGKAGQFDFNEELAGFRAGAAELDPGRSGLYLRYQLLCAWALREKHLTPQALLTEPLDAVAIERELAQ
jgi:hypothetical protein